MSNQPKWTPGPWKKREGAEWIIDGAVDYGRVASVGLGRRDVIANAHLIAAAPDLYTALEELLGAYTIDAGEVDRRLARKDAENALRKARGQA